MWPRRAPGLAFVAAALLGAAGCEPAPSPQRAAVALSRARYLAEHGRADAAIDALYRILDRYPDNTAAHLLFIELRARTERVVVQREYERKLKAEPENALLYFLLGKARDEPAEQAKLYRKAVELEPELALAHLELGRVCRSKAVDDLAASRRALDAAASLRPDWAEAHLELARTLSAQGQMPEALAAYRRAIELEPASEPAWFELACLQSRTEPAATEKTLAEAVRRCPASGRLWWHLADFQWTRGARAEAAASIERALALDAEASWAAQARDRLAAHYLSSGWHAKARRLGATAWADAADEMAAGRLSAEAFRLLSHPRLGSAAERVERLERAARLAPKSAAAQQALGDALFAAGRHAAAAVAYGKVRAIRPGDAGALRRYVEAELLAGQPAAALKALGPGRRRIAPDAALLIADAEALAAKQLSSEAIAARYAGDRQDACPTKREEWQRLLRECVARFPAYLTPRLELARSLREAGNAAEAQAALEAAAGVKGHPLAEADLQTQLGDAAMAAKDYPKAIGHYRAAIARCPDLARQHGALARACAADGQLGPAQEALTRQLVLDPHAYDLAARAPAGRGQGCLLAPRLGVGDVFRYRYETDGGQPSRALARLEFDYVVEDLSPGELAEATIEVVSVSGRPVEGGKDFVGARPFVKCSTSFGLTAVDRSARGMPREFADLLWLVQFLHGPALPVRRWPGQTWRATQWTDQGQPRDWTVAFDRVRRGKAYLSVAVSREGPAADPAMQLERVAATGRAAIVFDLERQAVERIDLVLRRAQAGERGSRAELPPWLHRLELRGVERGARKALLRRSP